MNYLDILVRASIDVTAATENIKLPHAGTQVRRAPVHTRSKTPCPGRAALALIPQHGDPVKEKSHNISRCCHRTLYFNRITEERSESFSGASGSAVHRVDLGAAARWTRCTSPHHHQPGCMRPDVGLMAPQ